MCDNKYLEKKRLQLKEKAAELKEQRSEIKRTIKRAKQKKCPGKEVQKKEINSGIGGNSTNTEGCNDKWAAYTSVGIGQAPNVIKQVEKYFFLSNHKIVSGQFHPCQR